MICDNTILLKPNWAGACGDARRKLPPKAAGLVCFSITLTRNSSSTRMSYGSNQMPSAASHTSITSYSVEFDDDGYQVYFFDGFQQVAGAFVPGASRESFELANRIGGGFGIPVTYTVFAH